MLSTEDEDLVVVLRRRHRSAIERASVRLCWSSVMQKLKLAVVVDKAWRVSQIEVGPRKRQIDFCQIKQIESVENASIGSQCRMLFVGAESMSEKWFDKAKSLANVVLTSERLVFVVNKELFDEFVDRHENMAFIHWGGTRPLPVGTFSKEHGRGVWFRTSFTETLGLGLREPEIEYR